MKIGRSSKLTGALCAAAAMLCAGAAPAQSVADFYKGRNVTMLIGSGTGGGLPQNSRSSRP